MKIAACLFVLVISLVQVYSDDAVDLATAPCTPGTTRQFLCNTCTCGARGVGYRCTKLICPDHNKRKRSIADLAVQPCTPGEKVQHECNTCTCGFRGDGYQCTKMACPPVDARKKRETPEELYDLSVYPCTPGEKVQQWCNNCTCGVRGDGYQCTKEICPEDETRRKRDINDLAVQPCTPGEKVQHECNTCTCGFRGDGYQCTKQICPAADTRKKRDVDADRARCTPGTTFKIDCNTCVCGQNGVAACTQRGCLRTKRDINDLAVQPCTPGEKVQHECNTCTCGFRGDGYQCTKQICPAVETRKKRDVDADRARCIPGTTFKIDCNRCVCGQNGVAACTQLGCLRKKRDINDLAVQPCTPGEKVQHECNTCTCGFRGDGYQCTKQICPAVETRKKRDVSVPSVACVPGVSFKKDCNDCVCGETGHAVCTQKFCLRKKRDINDLAVQPCTPGEKVQHECNTCTCGFRGDGYQCTREICPAVETRKKRDVSVPSVACVPGVSFKKDCNDCVCGETGHAVCTQKFCLRKKRAINCEPGKSFKRECNTCRCGNDGRSAACTQKFCVRRDKRDRKDNSRS